MCHYFNYHFIYLIKLELFKVLEIEEWLKETQILFSTNMNVPSWLYDNMKSETDEPSELTKVEAKRRMKGH